MGQAERWTASFRGTGAVAVRVSGPEMTLVPISKGWWIVTIEARSRNLVAKQTFSVSVRDADTPAPAGDTLLDLSPEVSIPDANLRAVVRTALGLTEDDTLTQQKMHRLARLSAPTHGITNLAGLEHAIRLTELDMPGNQIADITPLRNLTTLFRIVLNENSITNITSLTGLTRLTHLNLSQKPNSHYRLARQFDRHHGITAAEESNREYPAACRIDSAHETITLRQSNQQRHAP